MRLAVISSSPFVKTANGYAAYSPYIKEMEIWARYSDEMSFFSPIWQTDNGLLVSPINFKVSKLYVAKEFDIKSFSGCIAALRYSVRNFYNIFRAMRAADHIHLRCPGNIGLMGCIAQVFFPSKPKTAKYAGNWDPRAQQPWTYKLQRRILSSTLLTKNMQVLVYGNWEGQSRNIKPFFTASYKESDKTPIAPRSFDGGIKAVFVGTLSPGKRPLFAVQLIEALYNKGIDITLSLYGHGKELGALQHYIAQQQLETVILLKGNQPQEIIREAYEKSHFIILPSKSEGWPKVVAEGMFWGCLPVATRVSCVPDMLGNASRGLLLDLDLQRDVAQLEALLAQPEEYRSRVTEAIQWSRKYTLDAFEREIKNLLQS